MGVEGWVGSSGEDFREWPVRGRHRRAREYCFLHLSMHLTNIYCAPIM